MTTLEHPNQQIYRQSGCTTELTKYDGVSTSLSKQQHSFCLSQTKRLPNPPKGRCNTQLCSYNLPTTKATRSAGFGIGDRFKQRSDSKIRDPSPPPNSYNLPSQFVPDNTTSTFAVHNIKDRSYCFGTGREAFTKVVMSKENLPADPATPGPGSYKHLKPIGSDKVAFKFKHKLYYGTPDQIALKKNNPSPCHYGDVAALNDKGIYNYNSEWNNSKAQRWSPAKNRFADTLHKNSNLGPGLHENHGEICGQNTTPNQMGFAINSMYHSVKSPTFGIGDRPTQAKRFITPAPGHYRLPSDFGYVDCSPSTTTPTYKKKERTTKIKSRNQSQIAFTQDQTHQEDSILSTKKMNSTTEKIGDGLVPNYTGRNEMNRTIQVGKKKMSINQRQTIQLYMGAGQAKTQQNFFSGRRKSSNQFKMNKKPQDININSLFTKEMNMQSKRFSHQQTGTYQPNINGKLQHTLTSPKNGDKKEFTPFTASNMDTSNCDRGTADITDRPNSFLQSMQDAPSPMKFYDSQQNDNTPTAGIEQAKVEIEIK